MTGVFFKKAFRHGNKCNFCGSKKKSFSLKAVNHTAERAVKLMQYFHGKITAKEEQKQYLLRCVQEHRKLYPDCKNEILKIKYSHSFLFSLIYNILIWCYLFLFHCINKNIIVRWSSEILGRSKNSQLLKTLWSSRHLLVILQGWNFGCE